MLKRDYSSSNPFRLVWEGLPHTLGSLEIIGPVLERLAERYPIELWLVTDKTFYSYLDRYWKISAEKVTKHVFKNIKLVEWNKDSVSGVICSCDLAVIPIDLSDPFAYGKPENKLLLFWRLGIPVLTSASPAYLRVMSAAGLDMTCCSSKEWEVKMEYYLNNKEARMNAARIGLNYVEDYYTEEENLEKWDKVFESLFGSKIYL
jgi:glycosyltransferase involved in cell wall biosynthesis